MSQPKPVKKSRSSSRFAANADELIVRHREVLRKNLSPIQSMLASLILEDIGGYRPGGKVSRVLGDLLIDIADHFKHWGRRDNTDGTLAPPDPVAAIAMTAPEINV